MATHDTIIHVHLNDTGEDFYFGCIKAIYTRLDHKQVGCRKYRLYQHGLPYTNDKATIKRGEVVRMAQNKKKRLTLRHGKQELYI